MAAKVMEFSANMVESGLLSFNDIVYSAYQQLTDTGTAMATWDTISNTVVDAIKPFCYTIIGITFLIEFVQELTRSDMLRWEQATKTLIKMVLAKVVIDAAPDVLKAIFYQSTAWVSAVLAKATAIMGIDRTGVTTDDLMQHLIPASTISDIYDVLGELSAPGIPKAVIFAALTIVVYLIFKLAGGIVYIIVFARMFQLYMYLSVSPLPCAFFPLSEGGGGGFSHITINFFKNFIACALHGVMIMVCFLIYKSFIGTLLDEFLAINAAVTDPFTAAVEMMGSIALGTLILVLIILKSGSWAKETMGMG